MANAEPNHNQQDDVALSRYINPTLNREDYSSWDDYFMAFAFSTSQSSKDPNTKVGACIVNRNDDRNEIVGTGYNMMPNGIADGELPWEGEGDWLDKKYPYVCHAELNAVMNKTCASLQNCTIYVTLYPCNECAKVIIQSGITEVVFDSNKYEEEDSFKASKIMFDKAEITHRQHKSQ